MQKSKAARAVKFETDSHQALDQYRMEMLVFGSPELSSVLRGHLLIERTIEALIAKNLARPEKLMDRHRITFEMKVDLADALGILPSAYVGAAKALNGIRNRYAHREDHQVSIEELNSLKIEWAPIQKDAFKVAVAKSREDAVQLAIIFLNWSFLRLLHPNEA